MDISCIISSHLLSCTMGVPRSLTTPFLLVVHWTVTTTTTTTTTNIYPSVEAFVQQFSPPPPTLAGSRGVLPSHDVCVPISSSSRSHRNPLRPRPWFASSSPDGSNNDDNSTNEATVDSVKKESSRPSSNGDDTSPSATAATSTSAVAVGAIRADDPYSFVVPILGDLHIDPRKMEDYTVGREHIVRIIDDAKQTLHLVGDDDDASEAAGMDRVALVSLGDLGESKNCDHNPDNPFELFAGTTKCHTMAAEFLNTFGVPYEVIGGNHDLEGIDEFDTDAKNLRRFLRAHNKTTPQFCRQVAEKTLLVGLGSTVFREAKYTSHEVIIDDDQIHWFEELARSKPAEDGWRIFVFSHAPPNGSGIRIIQENHVVNGCCWLNHSDEKKCRKFIEIVRENRCIKVSTWIECLPNTNRNVDDVASSDCMEQFLLSH